MSIHGDAFLRNLADLKAKLIKSGFQPIEFRVSNDVCRIYAKEIKNMIRPPIFPGAPPSLLGLKFQRDSRLRSGTVICMAEQGRGQTEFTMDMNGSKN